MVCKCCGKATDELCVFPGGICLECYERRFDAEVKRTGRLPVPDFKRAVRRSRLNHWVQLEFGVVR